MLWVVPSQSGQSIEVTLVAQSVLGGDGVEVVFEVPGEPQNAVYDRDSGGVDVGSSCGPFLDDAVRVVMPHEAPLP